MKYLICNLKNIYDLNGNILLIDKLRKAVIKDTKLIILPSYPFLGYYKDAHYTIGSQDISPYTSIMTGEVTGQQLSSLGCKYVLVGHSERKEKYKETLEVIVAKVKNALNNGMKAIYLIGEDEKLSYEDTIKHLEEELANVLNEFTREEIKNIIIGYEPKWAIGSGLYPKKEGLEHIIKFIKKIMKEYYELDSDVIYGGSISNRNINEYKSISLLDGFLICSLLNTEELNNIL